MLQEILTSEVIEYGMSTVHIHSLACTLGITVQRSSYIFTVGESASLTCSSDLSVVSIEWLHNFQVLSTSTASELSLNFNPVNDSIHGNEYTCRITTPYGIQEQTVQVIAQSTLLSL